MGHYLHRLAIRPARPLPSKRPRAHSPIGLGLLVGALVLLATSSLAAAALGRMSANLRGDVPRGWPADGCLVAGMAPWSGNLSGPVVAGSASLCLADGALHSKLDLDHLEPKHRYAEWLAYFESPGLCSLGQLVYQINNFNRPCTFSDLEGLTPHGIVRKVADAIADIEGVILVDDPIHDIDLRPHAQAWLLLSPPTWSPIPQPSDSLVRNTAPSPLARAVFDVP
jgi:hypothetical protein